MLIDHALGALYYEAALLPLHVLSIDVVPEQMRHQATGGEDAVPDVNVVVLNGRRALLPSPKERVQILYLDLLLLEEI